MAIDYDNLDPDVIRLGQAIKSQESSGGKNTVSPETIANGTSGAFEYKKDTFDTQAKALGGKDLNGNPLDINNPEHQNLVWYTWAKNLKDQGYGIDQIAAGHNAGEGHLTDWQDMKGVNKTSGFAYDTPKYVNDIVSKYQQLKGNTNPAADISNGTLPNDPTKDPNVLATINQMFDQGKSQAEVQDYIHSVKSGAIQPTPVQANPMDAMTLNEYGTSAGKQFTEGGEHILSSIIGGKNKMEEGVDQAKSGGVGNFLEGVTKYAEGGAQSFLGTFSGAFQTVLAPITPFIEKAVNQIAYQNPKLATTVVNSLKPMGDLAQKHPEEAGVIGDAINSLLAVVGEKLGGEKIKTEGFKTPEVSGLKFGSKSADDIMATAPENVSKLNANEQKFWYKNQSKSLTEQATEASIKAKESADIDLASTQKEINDFNQKIGQTSSEEAINLKEPAQKLMKDSSAQYLELTGEAADGSPALTKTIKPEDLSNKIDSKFEYNPEIAAKLKEDLNLNVEPKQGEISKELTNQDILDKAREIMQSVSKTAKTGGKVYSPAEYEAMQRYSFLMEVLGDNGVDMTAANKFWKQYAPVRDKIVSQIKPWDEGVKGTPIAKTIQTAKAPVSTLTAKQVASQIDAQRFISELESRMGLPKDSIGKDVAEQMQGLEKAKLNKSTINKIKTDALNKIKADKAEALRTMSLEQYNNGLIARKREIIKKVIWGALGLTILGGSAKHVVGAIL